MRIWDISPELLCRQHLLGEHRELHALWSILTEKKTGYANHSETRRWRGKLAALFQRHALLVEEMALRGYTHASPLDPALAVGISEQTEFVDTPDVQRARLKAKSCPCFADGNSVESTETRRQLSDY